MKSLKILTALPLLAALIFPACDFKRRPLYKFAKGAEVKTGVSFDSADTPGDWVSVTAGGVEFKMIYANNQDSITFPFSPNVGSPVDDNKETITQKFFMGETQVTWALWKAVYDWAVHADRGENVYSFENEGQMGSVYGGAGMTEQHPVTRVRWRDAVIWCNALSEMTGAEVVYVANGTNGTTNGDILRSSVTGKYSSKNVEDVVQVEKNTLILKGYRLPTSKEWEYTARYVGTDAGARTDYVSQGVNNGDNDLTPGYFWTPAAYASGGTGEYTGEDIDYPHFNPFGWYVKNTDNTTQPVKQKTPNALGLYDMSGNVSELCFTAKESGRVLRGGSCHISAEYMQVGFWGHVTPNLSDNYRGFRLAKSQ